MSMRQVRIRLCAGVLAIFVLFSSPAAAQSFGEGFSCSNGSPVGVLYDNGRVCEFGIDTFVTGTLCRYEKILGQVVSKMFCKAQFVMLDPLQKLLILYVIIIAILFTTGMSQFTAGEAFTHLMKVALVWAFASQAELTIGLLYTFFMNVCT